ncbi:hypothetical protein JOF46_002625 [Paeniglutamicibacter psychrophenolicus]|uniref:Uncharacterized protein n=1 Tax=Paeniglutamicibacter psychrophenolicus TaxID=257454 RepID=A0ABS4WET3_9MICC|nr:hypothetical protein [Paeniglutamicibacter psychrophenolicus]
MKDGKVLRVGVGIADGCIEGRVGQQTMPVALAEREFSHGRQQSRDIGERGPVVHGLELGVTVPREAKGLCRVFLVQPFDVAGTPNDPVVAFHDHCGAGPETHDRGLEFQQAQLSPK